MNKYLLVGAAAFALMAGSAFAQDSTATDTTSTTSTVAPPAGSYSSSRTQKSTDMYGAQTDKSQTYSSGANGTNASSSSETTAPDGSTISASHETRTATPVYVAPSGDTTTTTRSSTTTTNQ